MIFYVDLNLIDINCVNVIGSIISSIFFEVELLIYWKILKL